MDGGFFFFRSAVDDDDAPSDAHFISHASP
jgi:hypothetical protein